MLLKEFKYEEKNRKQQLLSENGVFLAKRVVPDFTLYLFQIGNFYVEMHFDEEEGQIGYMRAFTDVDQLAPYLASIDLSELFGD